MKHEFLLALPIEPMELGATFPKGTQLPLHCTLMHWFEFRDGSDYRKLVNELNRLSDAELVAAELISEGQDRFGSDNDVPVHVLKRTDELHILHNRIFESLAWLDALPRESRWTGAGWRPHVTDTDTKFLVGRSHTPYEIVLVERIEDGTMHVCTRWYPG